MVKDDVVDEDEDIKDEGFKGEAEGCPAAIKPPVKIRGEALISLGISCIGGKGAFNSAIILAISSLETCRLLSKVTEDGRVVTRIGVLGLKVGLGGTFKIV